ncbi:UDP-glucose--hexose-1-phosphate uridylyltransferase [Halobacillus litoralis]|uniref:UDP-glucose--hexose-1-phosphate uridylyltransferase n=1 Tax=Halobacillus litoralis TaxID=45668 RepID=UPI001CD738D2|nr:UDP-glucose--hexose-1-phosphate uridylyltransferase [Halobacillus litoralis]MCA0970725.1 UDP-glucose--hexose-1-phosphate uridylyltransferase [Halobacillus litoralis]
MNIYDTVQQLVDKALAAELIEETDVIYTRNQVLGQLDLDTFTPDGDNGLDRSIPDLLEVLVDYAAGQRLIDDVLDEKEQFQADLMNHFLPRPSDVNRTFKQKYEQDPVAATDYFYEMSQKSNYIQTKRIAQNVSFKADTEYGDLDITINLSKPEKDPKQIAKEREMKKTDADYPKCLLCVENEGYPGRIGHPARSNHRLVRLDLGGENWMLQYSPYVYYNEHSIVLSEKHVPMTIDRKTFDQLLEFTDQFPHYFIGSNADLPIVGGSILSHDHYQAGRYEFAMAKAEDAFTFPLDGHPDVEASVLKWPMSVVRLRGQNREELAALSDQVLSVWREYSDPEASVHAYSGDEPHNTVTPIARRRGEAFEVDLVLRNNRTSEEHPMGIFHPHEEVHHIKKENIGLIEVMGLAVLPARLKSELKEVEKFVAGEEAEVTENHQEWADDLKAAYAGGDVTAFVEEAVGEKFKQVLTHAGVFKQDEDGQAAFKRFIDTL